MTFNDIKNLHEAHIIPAYARTDVAFIHGKGARLYDNEGRDYIDFAAGIGVNSVGYAHPLWIEAVAAQAGKLAHTSNLYHTEPPALLAAKLTELSGLQKVFFSNSGAEANEGAIKLARKYSHDRYGCGRATVVTLRNSFHGRTMAALAATGQEKFHQHFMPFPDGFKYIDIECIQTLKTMENDICAVMVEPIQGEGGVVEMKPHRWKTLRRICDSRDWLLIADEVQTGIGRTGSWFAYQQLDALPDIVTFAKGIAGGLPLGGFIASEKCCDTLTPGTHGTTFGGNLISCAAALAVMDILEPVIPQVAEKGKKLSAALNALSRGGKARGLGLMLGMPVGNRDLQTAVRQMRHAGLITLGAGDNILRFLPPLTIDDGELEEGIERLKKGWTNL
jgi:acetylornithine/N-succinyldiaminopimelate aminotransferase